MAGWLREGIGCAEMPAATFVLHTDADMLGFVAVSEVQVRISHRERPILELHKHKVDCELAGGLMLSHIARARRTDDGFGHVLFDGVVGAATED